MSKMKVYTAAAVITLHEGRVQLTQEQARRRKSQITSKRNQKSGTYSIVKPVQFKVGECFGYDGEIPKAMLEQLEPEDDQGLDDTGSDDGSGSDDDLGSDDAD